MLRDKYPAPRRGARPQTGTCLPHCQMTEESSEAIFKEFVERATEMLQGNDKDALDYCVEVGPTGISVPSTFPAFHWNSRTMRPAGKDGGMNTMNTRNCFMVGTEFAHIHAKYFEKDPLRSAKQDTRERDRPWQVWQGGGLGSMHLTLDLQDAEELNRLGWTEFHLLAAQKHPGVPAGLVLVYAPRNEEEIEVCLKILQASLDFVVAHFR
ncbi:unnamed protein product [Amoebophrya sp. A120]|nr:unnamed protein product [Amoebophrya sp. A120]CAD7975597.1 unnamed protein product [Amoebophrya sp. A120]|eukprot:GSA120T00013177001.1